MAFEVILIIDGNQYTMTKNCAVAPITNSVPTVIFEGRIYEGTLATEKKYFKPVPSLADHLAIARAQIHGNG